MINLLSPDDKKQLRAARVNYLLIRYYFLIVLTILLAAVIFYVAFYIADSNTRASKIEFANSEEEKKDYKDVRQRAKEFEGNLKTAEQILAIEVVYSRMITDIASFMPSGTILTKLSLSPKTINQKMEFSFKAKNNQGVQLKTAFENSKSFSDVSISRITEKQSSEEGGQDPYQYEIIIGAKFHPNQTIPAKATSRSNP